MKALVEITKNISAPPAKVWECLTDLNSHQSWNPHLISLEPKTALVPGSRYKTISKVMGRELTAHNLVTKFQPLDELEIENQSGPLCYLITYVLAPEGESTKLVCRCQVSSQSAMFQLATPVIEMMARDQISSNLEDLKKLVEAEAVSK